ncbi:flavin-containing monooxygenase [Thermaurantiacus sp.]
MADAPTTDAPTAAADDLGFDPDALRARYRAERDKRLRPDGNDQYVEVKGRFAHFLEDPYTPVTPRAPLNDRFDVLVVGGGFGGLLAAARLREAGVASLRVVEKAGDFGGTWYWNRYPGAACDIESYIYLPLLEEMGFMPSRKYARAAEILDYSRRIARHYGLYDDALLSTEVTRMDWDDAAERWVVTTNRGDALRPRFVVLANGPLNRPKLPGIPGLERFAGHSFHTSRWDYAYTGGHAEGGLNRLSDKVVGIIGTGATAVQCVPHLAEGAKHLFVFQRTPSSIDVRADRPTDPDWAASLAPGWHQKRMDNFNILVSGGWQDEDLVADGWTDIIRNLGIIARRRAEREGGAVDPRELVQLADFRKMESIRARVDAIVQDPKTAEALKPWYNQFCKRPCFHDEYLAAFNRPNVTLVDTDGKGVEAITERGVVANGVEYPLDCLIFATGFEVGTAYERRAGTEIHGRGGTTLQQKWADGCRTLHGMTVNGFPNMLLMSHIQSAFTANYPHALGEQARHAAFLVAEALKRGATRMEPTPEAEAAWAAEIAEAALDMRAFQEACTPGYYNNEGQPNAWLQSFGSYGRGSMAFFELTRRWREAGDCAGLVFSTPVKEELHGQAA